MKKSLSVIIPTYNRASLIENLFESLVNSENQSFEIIVNDDKRSTNKIKPVIKKYKDMGLSIIYIQDNYSMAQGRKRGADLATTDILLHLDSDMKVTPKLIGECIEKIKHGYVALVIPEISYGNTFWAKCKWLEKKCYEGVSQIESLRCITTKAYKQVGGHDERMIQSEDKDLDIRVRNSRVSLGRTESVLYHNEGDLHLIKAIQKKYRYSHSANIFAEEHPHAYFWQANLFNRYILYLKNIKYLFQHPLLYIGMFFMKSCEFLAGAIGLIQTKLHTKSSKTI